MIEVVLSGYYGFDNMGDEAILYSLITGLKEAEKPCRINVLSASPRKTSKRYGVEAVSRTSPGNILSALRRSDIFLSGGGSLIQDATSLRSPLYYLGLLAFSRFFSSCTAFAFQGVGPLNTAPVRMMTARAIKKADIVSVRDEDSRNLLTSLGLEKESIRVVPDPVFSLFSGDRPKGVDAGGERTPLQLGVAVRPWQDDSYLDPLTEGIIGFSRDIDELEITLLPLHRGRDEKAAEEVAGGLRQREGLNKDIITVNLKTPPEHPAKITDKFSGLDMLLGVRLHSLIFATLLGIPCAGIEYDPKISAFLKQIDLEPIGTTSDLSPRDVGLGLRRTLNRSEIISKKQQDYSREQKKEIACHLEEILSSVKEGKAD